MQREDAAAEIAQARRVAVGREHDRLGAHDPLGCGERHRAPLLHLRHRRVLVDLDVAAQHAPHAADEVDPVDPPRRRVEHRPHRPLRAQPPVQRLAVQVLHRDAPRPQRLDLLVGRLGPRGVCVDLQAPVSRVAHGQRVFADDRLDAVDAVARARVHPPRRLRLVARHPVDPIEHQAAVATARAVREPLRLEQDHPPLREAPAHVVRGGHAREAAADDGQIGARVAAQRVRGGRGGVHPDRAVLVEVVHRPANATRSNGDAA